MLSWLGPSAKTRPGAPQKFWRSPANSRGSQEFRGPQGGLLQPRAEEGPEEARTKVARAAAESAVWGFRFWQRAAAWAALPLAWALRGRRAQAQRVSESRAARVALQPAARTQREPTPAELAQQARPAASKASSFELRQAQLVAEVEAPYGEEWPVQPAPRGTACPKSPRPDP